MKKLVKILPILMVVVAILTAVTPIFAGQKVGDVTITPNTDSANKISGISNSILGIIRVVGTVIAVGVLMVIGIKYMMGSAEEKAEYKKTMLPYLIGALILFAAVQIAGYVYDIATSVTKTDSKEGKEGAYVITVDDTTTIA